VIGVALALGACGDDDTQADPGGEAAVGATPCPPEAGADERTTQFDSAPQGCIDPSATYEAAMTTSRGEITIELYPSLAPKAVNNFVFLARHRYFDGVEFHRIIPGFVVQGGDAVGNPPGTGGPGYQFEDELPTDGPPFYAVGSLAMANSGPDTNGSQFFIVTGDQGAQLPPSYSLFGAVVDGMDVVEEIEATGTGGGTPSEPTTIESVTVTEQ
jgi:cyclophilin family peptidyl-prolyl cis-trans isomerase